MAGLLGTISGQVRLNITQAVAAYAALRAQNARTVYALRGTGDSFVAAGQTMAVAGGVMVYAFARVVMAAGEFERKMDFAAAVSGATGKQISQLGDYALDVAEKTIYSANEIAEGFIELAKAGVSAEGIVNGIGEAMANLGAAGDIPLTQSGQIITSTIQQFDLAARDAIKVTDLLAGAANASIADISDIGTSLKYVGGVANAVGLTFEDTTTAISLLAKAGIRGSTAGTSLRQMLVSLGGATEPARDSLKELGIITADGTNRFFDAEGNAKSLSQVFQILQKSTEDLTAKERLMHMRTIFNNRALAAASILTREGADGFRAMNNQMSKTTAAEVASERLDNLSGDIEILRGNIETMMIRAGGPFQETIRGWVQMLTRLVQAFDDLDPGTQKFIVQTVGIVGASLVAMGAFSIFIGTIFRFLAAVKKLAAGLGFLFRIIRVVAVNARFAAILFGGPLVAAIGAITLPVWAAIAVLAAFGAAFIIAYKKSETFRNFIGTIGQAVWNAIKSIAGFFKLLVTDPAAAWDQLRALVIGGVAAIGGAIARLPGLIMAGLGAAVSFVAGWVGRIVGFLASLPGRALGIISSFVSRVVSLLTFKNVGYALGFLVGTVVRFFLQLAARGIALAGRFANGVARFFATLPGRVGYLIGFLVGRVVGGMIRLGARMIALAGRAVTGTINFFTKLPGRVAGFVLSMSARAVSIMAGFAVRIPSLAAQAVTGTVGFIQSLPSRVASFIIAMVSRARSLFTQFKTTAIQMATQMVTGFVGAIRGLPGLVGGIAGEIIAAFKSKITSAAAAVRDFAKGMWEGFKDGLGIGSPSHLERAAWQITDVLDKETKKIARKTMDIQKLSKRLAETQFNVGNPLATSRPMRYSDLASMQARNRQRAGALLAARGIRPAGGPAGGRRGRDRLVSGELNLTPSGRAFIRGVAKEVFDENDDFDDDTGRMNF